MLPQFTPISNLLQNKKYADINTTIKIIISSVINDDLDNKEVILLLSELNQIKNSVVFNLYNFLTEYPDTLTFIYALKKQFLADKEPDELTLFYQQIISNYDSQFIKPTISHITDFKQNSKNLKFLMGNSHKTKAFIPSFLIQSLQKEYLEYYLDEPYSQLFFEQIALPYKKFLTLSKKLLNNPEDMSEIINYWKENKNLLNDPYHDKKKIELRYFEQEHIEILTGNYHPTDIHEAQLHFLNIYKAQIADNLFSHFIKYPEIQEKNEKTFPLYFHFFRWLPSDSQNFFDSLLEQKHIDILKFYSDKVLFAQYMNSLFENKELADATSLINKNIHWDDLFVFYEHPFVSKFDDYIDTLSISDDDKITLKKFYYHQKLNQQLSIKPTNEIKKNKL